MSNRDETRAKMHSLLSRLARKDEDLALLKDVLEEIGFRIFPRAECMALPGITDSARRSAARRGVILDCETTGLDPAKDVVIQLSMLRILYDEKGIIEIGDSFDAYQDPGRPIPEEITRITGITDEMVAGARIDPEDVRQFLSGVDMTIAHNAGFDRKFVEAGFPGVGFDAMDWHCSLTQIDWKGRGMGSGSLELLAQKSGFVYDAHNSRSDILATAFILSTASPDHPAPFTEMMAEADLSPRHVIAVNSPFSAKDALKARGYRWATPEEPVHGFSKVWHKIIPGSPEAMAEEAEFLREVFGRDISLPMFSCDQKTRYSARKPERCEDFSTLETTSKWARLKAISDGDPALDVTVNNTL